MKRLLFICALAAWSLDANAQSEGREYALTASTGSWEPPAMIWISDSKVGGGDGFTYEAVEVGESTVVFTLRRGEQGYSIRLVKDGDALRGTWRATGVEEGSGTLSYVVRPWCCDQTHLDGNRTEHCVASDQIKAQQAKGCKGFKPR